MKIKKADFVKSAVYEKDYPEQLDKIEFAFVGRSNVGKSSLIKNMVAHLWLQSWVRPLSIVSIYRNMYVEVATLKSYPILLELLETPKASITTT